MNGENLFNQADSMLPNNVLEEKLLAIQIAQLCLMLFSELVARPPEYVQTIIYVTLIVVGAALLAVALSSTAANAVIVSWHNLEPYLKWLEQQVAKKLRLALFVASCGRCKKTEEEAAAAAEAARKKSAANAESSSAVSVLHVSRATFHNCLRFIHSPTQKERKKERKL